MPTLTETIIFATQCHDGQTDKAGAPYILHPLRVLGYLGHQATSEERELALLHDVMEDCGVTDEDLRYRGYGEPVIEALHFLSKLPGEEADTECGYERFIERCAANPLAARVKLADLSDNMDRSRLGLPTPKDLVRLEKYRKAVDVLKGRSSST